MFKNHPKGLIAASLSNMGERFGFYIMMAILTLFLMSKFGLDIKNKVLFTLYSIFVSMHLPLSGDLLQIRLKNTKVQFRLV